PDPGRPQLPHRSAYGDRRLRRHRGQHDDRPQLQNRRRGDDQRTPRDPRRHGDLRGHRGIRLDPLARRVYRHVSRLAASRVETRRGGYAPIAHDTRAVAGARARARDRGDVIVPTMDINEIMRHLPHRYPFLLVDRVLECDVGQRIKAIKNVTLNEPFFQGHFPGYPVMPGVLVIEAMAQVSAILAYVTRGECHDEKSLLFFAGIDDARFKRPVFPGDQLILESVELNVVRGVFKFAAKASVGAELVAEAKLMAAVRDVRA